MIITASTRPGRVGAPVANWIAAVARDDDRFELDLVDLADIDLPLLDEPHHPRLQNYEHDHTRRWSTRVSSADALIIVMPEYNYGFSAPIKNALDYLHVEWRYMPVGLVSYGGVSAGTRAAQMLKQVLTTLKMMPLFEAVSIPFVQQFIGEDGTLQPNDVMAQAATAMLDELVRMQRAMQPLRDEALGR